ncbi:MAG: thioester reductase, partial [Planctomycetes bacterium]|nr:thioester reductase [Planctomycetota bacterium]
MAYFLDLQGPSLSINTACSSSLVAIDLACQQLKNRSIDLAIAGGITIYDHPGAFIAMNNAGMLSPTGECRPFDSQANGIVVGDGVGIVILKPLEEAIADQDPIYGVIVASGTNQDGKTSGITVPSFLSQSELESSLYHQSQINVEDIQYIETHGTGTKLGDPIEIHALNRSFQQFTNKSRFCAIGSLKANIGHTTAAAGVLSIIKVLLSFEHQQIPPSINFEIENEHIEFGESPFYVNTSLKEWPENSQGSRLAAVSSFGFSGTNAHLVLEEAPPSLSQARPIVPTSVTRDPLLIPLSAKNRERLRACVEQLYFFLQQKEGTKEDQEKTVEYRLEDIAYTLQVGRSVLEERVVFLVKDEFDLVEKLKPYLENEESVKECYQGSVKRKDENMETLLIDEDMLQTIASWITKKKYSQLMKLWVKGLVFDWNLLYKDSTPTRIHLPTYPFAKERYWIPDTQDNLLASTAGTHVSVIHPLLHENTSDLSVQRFTSSFTGKEFFFADHQVIGEKVLPGVAYLEMARAAVEKASGETEDGTSICLKNVVWTQPIVIDGSSQKVHIGLFGEDDGHIQYEVYTESDNEDYAIVHSQGLAEFKMKEEIPPLDVQDLQSQMNRGTLSADSCYQAFKEMGIEYGEGHREIQKIYQGENQVLARLSLPSSVYDTQGEYVLHPSLMDSAHQSSIGLMLKQEVLPDGSQSVSFWSEAPIKSSLPFALESLETLASCTSEMYAWVRHSGGSAPSNKIQKLDIDICDEQGNICVKMQGLTLQELEITSQGFEITSQGFEKMSQDRKAVELATPATDFVIPSSMHKPKTVKLKNLSGLETIPIDSSFENKRSSVGLTLQTSTPPTDFLSTKETQQPDPSPQPLITKETLQEELKTSLAKALYMKESDIDEGKPFIDMGLDSIVGVEWIKSINQEYGTSVSATKVYDYPTIQKFAVFIEQEIKKLPTSASKKASATTSGTLLQTQGSISVVSSLHHHIKARRKPHPIVVKGRGVSNDKIAIVGMSGRYPDACNLNQYWDNLVQGRNSIREIPQSRWDVSQYYDPDPAKKRKVYCKWLGMLDDIDCFDPLFFQISPAEAEVMDPQHRLFLQEGYKAFEDAGYSNATLSNKKCGVYLGIMSNEYSLLLSQRKLVSTDTTGNSYAIAAARIAYYLNLKGPAIPVDTACSSSLVAIHLACQALLNHEIDMALAGGVSLYLTPESYLGMCQAGMLSPQGQCKTFDDSANGFVPGEGVGAAVLKRLKDAERDNDSIYGVILGSGINQDGKTNGITAPSVNSQIELERDIYSKYKIDPESISYVETHGTGTKLGDPIELEALSTVFQEKTKKKNYCALASVKSNIGHTSGAAGVASVHKVLLSMKHQKLVPSLHCTKENAHFDFKNSPFYVNKETKVWETNVNSLRRACVSSFGFSGTNA